MNRDHLKRTQELWQQIERLNKSFWDENVKAGVSEDDMVAVLLGATMSTALQYAAAIHMPADKLMIMYQVAQACEDQMAQDEQDQSQEPIQTSGTVSKLN